MDARSINLDRREVKAVMGCEAEANYPALPAEVGCVRMYMTGSNVSSFHVPKVNCEPMRNQPEDAKLELDELRKHYDFDYAKARPNRFAVRLSEETTLVVLDPSEDPVSCPSN
jgi:hypothetical protein